MRDSAYFCPTCIQEDLGFHGIAYWRRHHQLPGTYACKKHNVALNYVTRHDAFSLSPSDCLADCKTVSEAWFQVLNANASIQRFLEISNDLLAYGQPLDEQEVSTAARQQAIKLGIATGTIAGARQFLSDLVRRQFNWEWLDSVVPGLVEGRHGMYWRPIDGAVLGTRLGLPSVTYALVFAALFENSVDAIHAMVTPPGKSARRKLDGRPRSQSVSDDRLRAAYVEAAGGQAAIVTRLQIGACAVERRLGRLGLPTLDQVDAGKLEDVINAVLAGEATLVDACHSHGLQYSRVRAAMKGGLRPLLAALSKIKTDLDFRPAPRESRTEQLPDQLAEQADESRAGSMKKDHCDAPSAAVA